MKRILLVSAVVSALGAGACVRVEPPPLVHTVTLDDPRVRVSYIAAGEAAPGYGVWMSRETFEMLMARIQGLKPLATSERPSGGAQWK